MTYSFTKFNKTEARKRYNNGQDVILVGDNVNTMHILSGWNLGITINKNDDKESQDMGYPIPSFDWRVSNFEGYQPRAQGRRCAYYQVAE